MRYKHINLIIHIEKDKSVCLQNEFAYRNTLQSWQTKVNDSSDAIQASKNHNICVHQMRHHAISITAKYWDL